MIHSYELVQEVRKRIHDRDSRVVDDTEILKTGDDQCRSIWDIVRTSNEGLSIDRLDVTTAAIPAVQEDAIEYALPPYVGDIQEIEGLVGAGTGASALKILRAGVEDKDVGRHSYSNAAPRWLYSRGQALASIQIRGGLGGVHTIRIWFVRRWAPLAFGIGTTGGASSTTVLVPATVTGAYRARTGLYAGMELEVYGDSGAPTNVGQLARITDQTTGTWTLSPALPAATSATTLWSILLPVPESGARLLVEMVAMDLLQRMGNDEEVAQCHDRIFGDGRPGNPGLKFEFEQRVANRSSGEPRRITNSRMYGR